MTCQLLGDQLGHLRIKWRQDLVQRLYERDGNTSMTKILGDLKADEATTDHNGVSGACVDGIAHSLNVLHRPKWQCSFNSRYRWDDRRSPRAQHEPVVGKLVGGLGCQVSNGDGLGLWVNRLDLAGFAHVEAKPFMKRRRGLQEQVGLVLDHTAAVVGQSTVRVAHVTASLEHDDLHLGVEAPQPRRSRHPTGDTADDHNARGSPLCQAQEELLEPRGYVVSVERWISEALPQAGGDQGEGGRVDGLAHRGHLRDDRLTVTSLLHHSHDGAQLTVRALQSLRNPGRLFGVLQHVSGTSSHAVHLSYPLGYRIGMRCAQGARRPLLPAHLAGRLAAPASSSDPLP